jgi:hypothetical protein
LKKVETIYRFHKSVYEETAAFNFSMEPLKTIGCGSRFQSDIVGGKMILIFVEFYKEGKNSISRMFKRNDTRKNRQLQGALFSVTRIL